MFHAILGWYDDFKFTWAWVKIFHVRLNTKKINIYGECVLSIHEECGVSIHEECGVSIHEGANKIVNSDVAKTLENVQETSSHLL